MTYKRGDVVTVRFPNSDLTSYTKRPAIIVQADQIETGIDQKLLALITSNLNRTGTTRVSVAHNTDLGKQMGLLKDSVVVTDNIATVKNYMIGSKIGHCSDIEAINAALRESLGL